jgi:hypothetical protein
MKYTKAQRHAIYKKALKHYKETDSFFVGLCWIICRVAQIPISTANYKTLPVLFPEFKNHKPKKRVSPFDYWWPLDDSQSRIIALRIMIKQTAPKK